VRHLTLAGEVDISCADEIVERALEALNNARIETLVIELAKVTFMDSSGIGALFRINAEADKSGKSMTLRAVPRQVRELLTITGLDLLIPIEDRDASPDPR
jgi:stage II sporulation protein AA (anti-sigma F factor antagonist)